jgi:hypothetical protein
MAAPPAITLNSTFAYAKAHKKPPLEIHCVVLVTKKFTALF